MFKKNEHVKIGIRTDTHAQLAYKPYIVYPQVSATRGSAGHAMDRVLGSTDMATKLKHHMTVAERARVCEQIGILEAKLRSEKETIASICLDGVDPALVASIRALATNEQMQFDIKRTKTMMEHAQRMIAIGDMWGGAGGTGELDPEASAAVLPIYQRPSRIIEIDMTNWQTMPLQPVPDFTMPAYLPTGNAS